MITVRFALLNQLDRQVQEVSLVRVALLVLVPFVALGLAVFDVVSIGLCAYDAQNGK